MRARIGQFYKTPKGIYKVVGYDQSFLMVDQYDRVKLLDNKWDKIGSLLCPAFEFNRTLSEGKIIPIPPPA